MITLEAAPWRDVRSMRRIYVLTGVIVCLGFAFSWLNYGFRLAIAFALGGLISTVNLFLFGYLAKAISPASANPKRWEARAFITRYLLMFAGGYVIVRSLDVSPLAVVLGLLTSTLAVIASLLVELAERLLTKSNLP